MVKNIWHHFGSHAFKLFRLYIHQVIFRSLEKTKYYIKFCFCCSEKLVVFCLLSAIKKSYQYKFFMFSNKQHSIRLPLWPEYFLILQFFTTKPYACEPSSLPKYPPSKEIDAKRRDEEARRFLIIDLLPSLIQVSKILWNLCYLNSGLEQSKPFIERCHPEELEHLHISTIIESVLDYFTPEKQI